MNYTKPEVAVLGEAVRVIESAPFNKGSYIPTDAPPKAGHVNPAYDLDE
jgi:hypothetical protein